MREIREILNELSTALTAKYSSGYDDVYIDVRVDHLDVSTLSEGKKYVFVVGLDIAQTHKTRHSAG